MGTLALDIKDLSRSFVNREVLIGVNAEINGGETIALCGKNGSGKTTLFRVLSTLITPSKGDVRITGYSVSQDYRLIRKKIGWAPASDTGFMPRMTGKENLFFFGALRGLKKNQVLRSIETLKNWNPLQLSLDTPFYLCSAGMKQSLNISRVFLHNPELILLDEPTRSLDSESSSFLFKLLKEKTAEGKTVVFSTHSEQEAAQFGTRTLLLRDGRLN